MVLVRIAGLLILLALASLASYACGFGDPLDRLMITGVDEPVVDDAVELPQTLGWRSATSLMYWPYFDQREYRGEICNEAVEDDYFEGEEPDDPGDPIDLGTVRDDDVWDGLNDQLSKYATDEESVIQHIWIEQFRVVVFMARSSAIAWPSGTAIVSVSEFVLFDADPPPNWQVTDSGSLFLC